MCRNQRLPAHVRKFRICVAGKDIFLLKSFSKTTMEDVMKKAEISKGCLYSYYKNTYEILHDLVAYHNYNILENLRSIIDKYREFNNFDLVLNKIIDTIFAEKEIREIYALFLIEIKNSEKLKILHDKLKNDCLMNDEFVELIEIMVLSIEILGIQNNSVVFNGLYNKLSVIFRRNTLLQSSS